MPIALGTGTSGAKPAGGRRCAERVAGPVEDRASDHNFLDLMHFLATVQSREAGLDFAIRPPIFCQPTLRKPVFNPKGS
jgi:hypothetical protein